MHILSYKRYVASSMSKLSPFYQLATNPSLDFPLRIIRKIVALEPVALALPVKVAWLVHLKEPILPSRKPFQHRRNPTPQPIQCVNRLDILFSERLDYQEQTDAENDEDNAGETK
jgi:hypothetical protein